MKALLAAVLLSAATSVAAEQVRRFDGYEIHYNAFRADFLPESIAKQFGLTRAPDRGLLNVTVLRPRSDETLESIEADVRVVVSQGDARSDVRMRPVREPGSVSYMGQFKVAGELPYNFELQVKPFGSARSEKIRFRQVVEAQ
ncbi:MAG TPA: DUF4426 domain-containing protein [Xanthomonadales bacterium]|nr:DUF4426 domain-containing protein [Xanthomonadales bacterium]